MASQVLVALADAWGSRHGGVNAFNYDLCGGLASRLRGTVPIVCVVPRASEDDRRAASKASVILLSTESDALDSGMFGWFSSVPAIGRLCGGLGTTLLPDRSL